MSIYANGLTIHLNEVALLKFMMNTQDGSSNVATIAVVYDALKQMHQAIGNVIEQHEKNLHQLKSDKVKAN